MRLPTADEWERIHVLSESLEPLPAPEQLARLGALRISEDPLIYSCLRAHLLVPEPEHDVELAPGSLVAGKYEIQARLAVGGMGIVYRATQRRTGRDIALKAIRPRMVSPALRARFEREIANLARLRHPTLVRLFDADVFTDPHGIEQLFYTMELVEGVGLETWMRESGASPGQRLTLLEKICRGVQAAHAQGIVHRDLKPQNILVGTDGQPVILDFGLARLRGELLAAEGSDPADGSAIAPLVSLLSGTPAYMDPEPTALTEAGEASDIYALGVIAFETLAGCLPFDLPENPSLRQVREAVAMGKRHALRDFRPTAPPSLDAVIQQAMRRRPVDRYPTAGHFADALLEQATRGQRLRRRTRLAFAFGALAAISVAAAAVATWARTDAEQRRAEAVRAEQESDRLVDFMLNDLRKRLEPTGRIDLLEPVVDRAVAHYEQRRREGGDSSATLHALADALETKGDVLGVRGKAQVAEAAFQEAIGHTRTLRDRSPRQLDAVLRLARARESLGNHLMRVGRYAEALAAYEEEKRELVASLPPGFGPERARWQMARCERSIGDALGYHLDRLPEAGVAYRASRDLYDGLLATHPDDRDLQEKRALLEASLGSLEETLGNFDAMADHFRAYHEHVLRTHGSGTLAFAHSAFRMGVAMVKTGDPQAAVEYLRPATEIAERNVAENPGESEALKLADWSLRYLAQALEGLGESADADQASRKAVAMRAELDRLADTPPPTGAGGLAAGLARLHRESTDDEEWSRFVHQVRLAIEADHGADPAARIAAYRTWLGKVAAMDPDPQRFNPQLALARAAFHNRIGDAHRVAGFPAHAAEAYLAAYELRHARWQSDPASARTQLDLLSSAGHRLSAEIEAGRQTPSLDAAHAYLDAARAASPAALLSNNLGLWHANQFADFADAAVSRWPDAAHTWQALAAEAAAQLLDRLPGDGATGQIAALRSRLLAPASR